VETWDAIRSRRNVREFASQPLDEATLDRILDAGRRTPSSRNWQPWDFVVVADPDQKSQLSKVWRGAWHVAKAPAVVAIVAPIVGSEQEREILHFDLGQLVMAMMVAAADAGVGTGHAVVADQDLARSILGLPKDRFCAYLISCGYPEGDPLRPLKMIKRRPLDEVVHRGVW
jgi:nitroreductase